MRTAAFAATIAVAGFVLTPSTRLEAQDWQGPAAFALRVTDDHGDPVGGAEVRVQASSAGVSGGPESVLTDELGQAVIGGLAEGEWFVEVSHPAYMLYAAYLDLEAGKKPQVGFSSQVNTETSWKPMTVKFFKASPELRRGATTRGRAAPPPPKVVRPEEGQETKKPSTGQRPEPPIVVRPAKPTGEAEPTGEEAREEEGATSAAPPAEPAPSSPPGSETAPTEPTGEAPPEPPSVATAGSEAPMTSATPGEPMPAELTPSETGTPQQPASREETEKPPEPTPPPTEELPASAGAVEEATVAAPPGVAESSAPREEIPEPAAPVEAAGSQPAAMPEPATVEAPEPNPMVPTEATHEEEASTAAPTESAVPAEMAPPTSEAEVTTEPKEAPASPPAPPETAGEETGAGAEAMASLPRYLRSAAAGNCPECDPGEWAVASEQEAGRAGELRSEQECSAEFVDGAARAARLLADTPAPRLEGYTGPVLPAMWRLGRNQRDEVEDLLVPRTDPTSHCQMAGVVLPAEARFSGYVLEAWDVLGGRSCRAGFDCAVGQSRWLGEPTVVEGSERTVVYGIFKNRSTRRERRARLTVYFQADEPWRPAVR